MKSELERFEQILLNQITDPAIRARAEHHIAQGEVAAAVKLAQEARKRVSNTRTGRHRR